MYNSQLSILICVADCGSFHKATEQLYISPITVMERINALKQHLGFPLMIRTSQDVRLTGADESVYKDTKYMIDYLDQAVKRARDLTEADHATLRMGTSMLNPCKLFVNLQYRTSVHFPQFKIQIAPCEDNHGGVLSMIERIGKDFDSIVGVCDSARWLEHCNFLKLGVYKEMIAVPLNHRLAGRKRFSVAGLYGETMMMVKRGDSTTNDLLHDGLERNHPQIRAEDTPHFYNIDVFNRCAESSYILLNLKCWKDIRPPLVSIPIDWDYTIPYGLLYSKTPFRDVLEFLDAVRPYAV